MAGHADGVAEEAARLRAEILELESGSDEQLTLYPGSVTMTQWSTMLHQNVDELDEMLHIILNGIRTATHAGRALFPLNEHLLAALAGAASCHIDRFDYRYVMSTWMRRNARDSSTGPWRRPGTRTVGGGWRTPGAWPGLDSP